MIDFLYTLIIFPLVQVIEVVHYCGIRLFRNEFWAIGGISLFVSVCTLPLYLMAEKQQKAERDIQAKLKPVVDNIKAVFKGDKRFMILQTYYRQNHYHPIYALRNSINLLIQIPFFIAAYSFLSKLAVLQGASFYFIKDLGAPDALFTIPARWGGGGVTLNILPVLMTLINCIAGAIYTKNLQRRDKVQVFGMAAVFLVLLYNSPSGLVLYWLLNNIFSLVKNIFQNIKNIKKIIYILTCLVAIAVAWYVIFINLGSLNSYRIASAIIMVLLILIPLWVKLFSYIEQKRDLSNSLFINPKTIILSSILLFLLSGLVIPSGLIASSVGDFSYLGSYTSPLHFVFLTALQSAGIFLFWPICIYLLSKGKARLILSVCSVFILSIAIMNTFVFAGNYGFMMPNLHLSEYKIASLSKQLLNVFVCLLGFITILYLISSKKLKFVIYPLFTVTALAFFTIGIMNVIKINKDFNRLSLDTNTKNENIGIDHLEKIYTFSKTGKNVIVIDLDMGISGYIPYIFEEKPELLNSFSGFTYYPNTISFGRVTIFGSPGIFGGYEYAPLEMKKRNTESYLRKLEESILMLPRIFSNRGYRTTLNDLQFAIDSAFAEYPEITVKKTHGKYLDYYYSQHNDLKVSDSVIKIKSNLIRFNFFKFSPLILRSFVYDGGEYLTYGTTYSLPAYTLDWYSQLYFLPEISTFQDKPENTFSILINEITHQPVAFFETPDYTPVSIVSNRGNGPFANEDFYHVNMAALLLLGKWFDFLKENDVYDNTRIIIVSDHGTNLHSAFPGNIILPDKRPLQWYQPILLVKDFNQKHSLLTDDTFMTNADVPVLATDGLISNPVNPFTGNAITAEKENGVTITTAIQLKAMKNLQKNHGSVKKDEWMHVHDNIFDINNWKQVEVTE